MFCQPMKIWRERRVKDFSTYLLSPLKKCEFKATVIMHFSHILCFNKSHSLLLKECSKWVTNQSRPSSGCIIFYHVQEIALFFQTLYLPWLQTAETQTFHVMQAKCCNASKMYLFCPQSACRITSEKPIIEGGVLSICSLLVSGSQQPLIEA